MDTKVPEDVITLARQAHRAFPTIPLLATDIVQEWISGKLYVLEVNGIGWTFHLTSDYGRRIKEMFGIDLAAQFGGAAAVARGIYWRLRAHERGDGEWPLCSAEGCNWASSVLSAH